MSIVSIFVAVLILLFVFAYITKRRFGILGLALAAGAMLSSLWSETLTPIIAGAGVTITNPPLISVVGSALVLLPAVLLLFHGPTYRKHSERLFGALLFALLAVAFLSEPLGSTFILTGENKQIYDLVIANRVYIVTIGLVFSILDLLFAKKSRYSRN